MSCGGGHLGFPTAIKNRKFVEDLPMIIPGQFGFNMKFKMAATAGLSLTLNPMGKMFQNASFLKHFMKHCRNIHHSVWKLLAC
jgi:hypothetical protein